MSKFLQTRGMLAKLLATENLVIEHDSRAKTASFDTENRVLKLPVLKTENENVYNMFCAHEVGHALQTPTYWKNDVPDDVPSDFVNVVEDVRIEKFIQNKFPGLRVDFSKGYDYLNESNFFAIQGVDISKMSLIDRINLHFKLGVRALVPFTEEEQVYVNAVDEADTWDKVLLVSKMISDFIGSKSDKSDTPEQPENEQSGESEEESEDSDTESTNSESDGDGDGTQTNDEVESGVQQPDETVSQTQRSFDESLKDISGDSFSAANEYIYATLGDIDLKELVVTIDNVRDTIEVADGNYQYEERERFNDFLRGIKGDVNHMVQQFEMKKSADAYARQQTHKTGVLDTNRLHNYKLTDDIFLRQSITPDGKCHGMVMYLDWSGSMSDISWETVKQIITLVQFCRKVQIPFEVYLFTTGGDSDFKQTDDLSLDKTLAHCCARIIQVVTSTSKKKQIDEDLWHLWCAGRITGAYGLSSYLPWSCYYSMGGTPLNNALMIVPELIKQFRQKTGAQKVSFVCITDGESSPLATYQKRIGYNEEEYVRVTYPYYETVMVRSGTQVFPISGRDTGDCVNWLKSQLDDVFISNIFLGKNAKSRYHLMSYGAKFDESVFRKTGSFVTTSDSWPIIGVINPNSFTDTTDEIVVEAGESKAKIKSALNKMLKTKSTSRLILTELVGQFA